MERTSRETIAALRAKDPLAFQGMKAIVSGRRSARA
jgi:hypothetical protein